MTEMKPSEVNDAMRRIMAELKAWANDSPFPPITAKNMLKQSRREGWQYQEHPVRFLRGKDHG